MTYRQALTGLTTALFSVLVVGCAGPTTDSRVALAETTASSSPTNNLCGTWGGYFAYIAGDHTSSSGSSALALQIDGDSTYTLKWGNRPPSTGKVVVQGNNIILQDTSGASLTLARKGDALYGMTKDNANGRPTMLSLEKQESAPGPVAAAGPRCS